MSSTLSKAVFLASLVLVALVASASMLIWSASFSSNDQFFGNNFGSSLGIHDIKKSVGEPVKGLPSTTYTLHVSNLNPKGALEYMSTYLSQKGGDTTQRINIHMLTDKSTTISGGFDVTFYATSAKDYADGTFDNAIKQAVALVSDNSSSNIVMVSSPTINGHRTISVADQLSAKVSNTGQELKDAWDSLIASASTFPLDGSRYNLTLNVLGTTKIVVSGFFYDSESVANLGKQPPLTWSTLGTYGENTFGINVSEVEYTIAQVRDSNDSTFKLTLKGKQPDSGSINDMVKRFTQSAYADLNVALSGPTITSIYYSDSKLPVWVNYPTNMLWPY